MDSPDYTPFWEETLRQIKQYLTEKGRLNEFVLWYNINYVGSQEGKIIASVASNYIRNEMNKRGYLSTIQDTFFKISGLDMELEIVIEERNSNKSRSSISFSDNSPTQQVSQQTNPVKHTFQSEVKESISLDNSNIDEKIVEKKTHPELSEQYSFENFISSDENAYVFNAALAVSKNPGVAYNPLLIYGGVGLGKTHLMQAIGNAMYEANNDTKIIYCTGELFANEVI